MKKKAANSEPAKENSEVTKNNEFRESSDPSFEDKAIEEFIKTRRLQNKILKKILENIPEPQSKNIQKKNK